MAIPVRSKQLKSLIDENQSQTENIIQQLFISEFLLIKRRDKPPPNHKFVYSHNEY